MDPIVSTTRPDWVSDDLYPFESRFFATASGHRMHFVDEGAGEPIVFVHGNPAWSFEFRHLIKGLRPEFRCVAPDHIGFGLSSRSDRREDCGEHLLFARLRPSDRDASAGSLKELERIVGQLRRHWPNTRIGIRGDSGFCRESIIGKDWRRPVRAHRPFASNLRAFSGTCARSAPESVSFEVSSFRSDNVSEFINHRVAALPPSASG